MATVKQCDKCKQVMDPADLYRLNQGTFPFARIFKRETINGTPAELDLCFRCLEKLRNHLEAWWRGE